MAARYVITLKDPEQQEFWEQLLAKLDFVEVEVSEERKPLKLSAKAQEFLKGLKESVQEMKDDISGKKKLRSAKSFIDELRS